MSQEQIYKVIFWVTLFYTISKIFVFFHTDVELLISISSLTTIMLVVLTLWLYGKSFKKNIISDKIFTILMSLFGFVYLVSDVMNWIA